MLMRVLLAAVVFAAIAIPSAPAQAQLSDDDIDRAMRKLQKYLLGKQDANGGWQSHYQNPHAGPSGVSAMVMYALVGSGVPVQHPKIQKAIKFLQGIEPESVYETGLRAHAWGQLPDVFLNEMKKDARLLENTAPDGVFHYKISAEPKSPSSGGKTPGHDHSNCQYGFLGLWEAAKRNVSVNPGFWKAVEAHFISAQLPDGGWNYRKGDERPSYMNMSLAGVTGLLIAQQELYRGSSKRSKRIGDSLDKGMKYLDKNYGAGNKWGLYGVYGMERVGLATGIKYFNKKDWFAHEAGKVVAKVNASGHYGAIYDDCFALLFLTRGRVPIWCTKLKVEGLNWNNRPNDIYFFTKSLGEMREGELNYQTVDLKDPPKNWFNAPIAWLSGDEKLDLTGDQKARLKQFLDGGGLLIANGEAGSAGGGMFKSSVRKLAAELYPKLKMAPLTNNHYLFKVHHRIDNGSGLRINALSNGARELIVMPDKDWGMLFQNSRKEDSQYKAAVNLFVLATERADLDNRMAVQMLGRKKGEVKGSISVGRAKYDGNWLPEPAVWDVMSTHMFNRTNMNIKAEDIDLTALGNATVPFVHLAGTDPVKLNDAQKAGIKQYVENGGTILVENVGGRRMFAIKMEEQLVELFKSAAASLGRGAKILNGEGVEGAFNNKYVTYRRYTVINAHVRNDPRLAAIMINGRPAVIISNEDVSLGALGGRREGVLGYSRKSSIKLLINMVLVAKQKPGAAPAAAAPAKAVEAEFSSK